MARPSDIFYQAWLQKQFDQIDAANALTLKKVEEVSQQNRLILAGTNQILELLDKVSDDVTPELEAAVKAVSLRATVIDRKVPDIS